MNTVASLLVLFFLLIPFPVLAGRSACTNSEITVVAESRDDRENVCEAARIGDAFFESNGLKLSGRLTVTLCKELPRSGLQNAFGFYDSRSNEIRLLDYEAALAASLHSPPSFGIPMTPVIWRSFVIHELAHAAAQQKFAPGVSISTASEYIATVAQLATLPRLEREQIMRNYQELSGFDDLAEISLLFYMLDPSRFSVKTYLHYCRPENGHRFIELLLREGLSDD